MLEELKITEQDWSDPYINLPTQPYHIILAGEGVKNVKWPDGTITSASDIKRDLGQCQLFAWNLEGKALLEWVKYLRENPDCPCKLVVDSGAYSAWSRGKEFDMDEYINFLNSNNVIETCFWAAEADKIPGRMNVEPTIEEKEAAPEISWQNYLYMIKRVKCPKKIVPIFHMHEDFKHLRRMIRYQHQDGSFIKYIGISPANDSHVNDKIKWYEKVWGIITEECNKLGREIPYTHNFGMTSLPLITQFPSYTSDSTSWIRGASFGNIQIIINDKIKSIYVSNRNPEAPDHINNQSLAVKEAVEKIVQEIGHGVTLKDLLEDDNGALRICFNIYSINKWCREFQYQGSADFKEELW